MNPLDVQKEYWNRVAGTKTFSHPLHLERFAPKLSRNATILDYGCGYGRTCEELLKRGYENVLGVDVAEGMIRRGKEGNPRLRLQTLRGKDLPFEEGSFDLCLLFALLTCVPTGEGQKHIVQELRRVLKEGGILYLSDYPLQEDERNRKRYEAHAEEFGIYGVFRLPDGGVMRHHHLSWFEELLEDFVPIHREILDVKTMNGNRASILQMGVRKTGKS